MLNLWVTNETLYKPFCIQKQKLNSNCTIVSGTVVSGTIISGIIVGDLNSVDLSTAEAIALQAVTLEKMNAERNKNGASSGKQTHFI